MAGATGFGVGLPGRGPQGVRGDVKPPNVNDDIHAIRERYCGGTTMLPQPFAFTANEGFRYDLTGQKINAIILTTLSGQVNGFFGDNTGGFGKAVVGGHFVGSAAVDVNTQVIPVTPGDNYIITLQEGAGSTTDGTITFVYE